MLTIMDDPEAPLASHLGVETTLDNISYTTLHSRHELSLMIGILNNFISTAP